MILKYFELHKLDISKKKFILLHGKNDGLKYEEILKLQTKIKREIKYYDEKQIVDNKENFISEISNKSLFENEKIIVVKRATDKIRPIIEELIERQPIGDIFFIDCDVLDKKSKIRNFFEKDKFQLVSVAFYPDTNETLIKLAYNFLRNKKISISPSNINFIINKCNGDRSNLNNELNKIELFSLSKKEINDQDLIKLINLNENHSINELIDFCLAKNQKKNFKHS
jgi:DNA polymerase-3 subunit delta